MKKMLGMLGMLGVIAAILFALLQHFGIFATPDILKIVLAAIGVYLGFTAVMGRETTEFMVAALILAAGTTALAILPFVGKLLQTVFGHLTILVAPAALVVAFKVIYAKLK
jgi:hypothetical protein